MRKDQLKPYVYKVKGEKNYALYDLFNGHFYQLTPEGDIEQLRTDLINEGLIFETEGVVPYKIKVELTSEANDLYIRELQIRLSGAPQKNCWSRKKAKKNDPVMNESIIRKIEDQFKFMKINTLRIECHKHHEKKVESLINSLQFESIQLYCTVDICEKEKHFLHDLCESRGIELEIREVAPFDVAELDINLYRFFYAQIYNSCLGHKVAIDAKGNIKPCLWADEILGNINQDNIRSYIINGKFDKFWELPKDSIDDCKICELRYGCNDCRITSEGKISLSEKPIFCKYDPMDGSYKE